MTDLSGRGRVLICCSTPSGIGAVQCAVQLATELSQLPVPPAVLIATTARSVPSLPLPPFCDTLKLPLALDVAASVLNAAVEVLAPDVIVAIDDTAAVSAGEIADLLGVATAEEARVARVS